MRSHSRASALGSWMRLAGVLVRRPREGRERLRGKVRRFTTRVERRLARTAPGGPSVTWAEAHAQLGLAWPCGACAEFPDVWRAVEETLAATGTPLGEVTHDADTAVAAAAWCLTRNTRPARVVETGVARGITTRVVLEAMARNGDGRLWSIDLPPLRGVERKQTAVAVVPELERRWTYRHGASAHVLPGLVSELDSVDGFVQDSDHSRQNVAFELETIVPRLAEGGWIVVDDASGIPGFAELAARFDPLRCVPVAKSGGCGFAVLRRAADGSASRTAD